MSERNAWEAFEEEHHCNEQLKNSISRIVVDLGIFVALDGGIDGIVHLSDLDWTIPGEEAIASYNVGDTIEMMILAIDPERERISLGIKQNTPDPRPDRRGEPPALVPVKPKNPRPPKPLSEGVER